MPARSPQPPWEFLLSASRNSLQSFELSRLAHAANLRKEISALIDQWMEGERRRHAGPLASGAAGTFRAAARCTFHGRFPREWSAFRVR